MRSWRSVNYKAKRMAGGLRMDEELEEYNTL